jgi:hypothetical protein
MKNLFASLMVVVLATFGLATVSSATAVADPYPGTVATTTTVKHRTSQPKMQRFKMRIKVTAAGASPNGTVTCQVNRKRGGFTYSRSKGYHGRAVKFRTPRLKKAGRYSFTCSYVPPPNSVFQGSSKKGSTKVLRG